MTDSAKTIAARIVMFLVLASACIVFTSRAMSQDIFQPNEVHQYKTLDRYRYLPHLPAGPENPPTLPNEPQKVTGSPKVLVEHLNALYFVDHKSKIDPKRSIDAPGVYIDPNSNLNLLRSPGFQRVVQPYMGGPVSLYRLNEMIRDIIVFYRNHDLPVVDVSIPEQDITTGTVQLIITEARVGEVIVEGPCYFNPCVLAEQVCISPGDRIFESTINDDLRWLARNPYRSIEMELTPGENPGETDVIFQVNDKKPVRYYGGYEDTGNVATGLERTFYGVNWYNAFDLDDQAGYQYTASSDFNSLSAHSAYYSHAFLNRDVFTVYGSYATFNSALNPPFNNGGRTWQLLNRWYRELCPWDCYEHGITAGFDFKNTNTNIDFGGARVFDSEAEIAQIMVGYVGKKFDNLGSSYIGVDGYFSPGNFSGQNDNQAFQVIRPGALSYYAYTRGFFERRFWVGNCWEAVGRVTGQVSSCNLLPTEQIGLGGYNSIRGYNLYSVVGDAGYFANMELWTPTIYNYITNDDTLRFLAFVDFGTAWQHSTVPPQPSSYDLAGTGIGARYFAKQGLELRFDYGIQLTDYDPLISFGQPSQRVHLGAVLSY